MVAFMHNATNVLLDRLARRQPLASSTFNGDIIYQALTNLPFGSEKRIAAMETDKPRRRCISQKATTGERGVRPTIG